MCADSGCLDTFIHSFLCTCESLKAGASVSFTCVRAPLSQEAQQKQQCAPCPNAIWCLRPSPARPLSIPTGPKRVLGRLSYLSALCRAQVAAPRRRHHRARPSRTFKRRQPAANSAEDHGRPPRARDARAGLHGCARAHSSPARAKSVPLHAPMCFALQAPMVPRGGQLKIGALNCEDAPPPTGVRP